jgi:hypothetical protein
MSRTDPFAEGVVARIGAAFPTAAITMFTTLPAVHQHPLHRVVLSDGTIIMASGPAVPRVKGSGVKTYSTTRSEAVVLSWLTGKRLQTRSAEASARPWTSDPAYATTRPSCDDALDTYLPRLLYHFEVEGGPRYFSMFGLEQLHRACNLTLPPAGQPLDTVMGPLSREERSSIDRQAGHVLRALASVKSPNGRFGMAAEVLSSLPALPPEYQPVLDRQGPLGRKGSQTWSGAFNRLMEEASYQASDNLSTIAFADVRDQFLRFRPVLDNVLRPRMFVLNGAEDANTLVIREAPSADLSTPSGQIGMHQPPEANGGYRVTGLQDWSNVVFGDPLMSSAFCVNPSTDVLRGFTGSDTVTSILQNIPECSFDDQRHVRIRLLLYKCYWIIMGIIRRTFDFNTQDPEVTRWHSARNTLAETVLELAAIPSVDMGPGRRARRSHQSRKRRRSASPPSMRYAGRGQMAWLYESNPSRRRRCNTP